MITLISALLVLQQPGSPISTVGGSTREAAVPLLEESYIALAPKMPEPLLFEANIAPHFVVSFAERRWGLVLTPKVVLRMLREESAPIRTPSYMPRLTAFVELGQDDWPGHRVLLSMMLAHHSNGEEGESLIEGRNNHGDGSFSTNYVEPGVTAVWRADGLAYAGVYLQQHLNGFNQNPEIRSQYGTSRLVFRGRVVVSRAVLHAELEKYIGTRKKHPDAELTPPQSFRIAVLYRPAWLDELAIMGAIFGGPDYYNIWYDRTLFTFRIGVAAFAFPGASP